MATTAHTYKIILLGEVGVGKTTLFLRLQMGDFVDLECRTNATLGIDYLERSYVFDEEEVRAFVTDTGGGEKYRTLTSNFYRHASAVILVYSVDDAYTFDNLQIWVEECKSSYEGTSDNIVWAVVGNKCDQPIEVPEDRVISRCKDLDTELYFYVSAKTGENVEAMLESVVKAVHESSMALQSQKKSESYPTSGIRVGSTAKQSSLPSNNDPCKC